MKILHVCLSYYPAVAWGGPVKNVYTISQELANRGHQVTVYSTNLYDRYNYIMPHTFIKNWGDVQVVYFKTYRIRRWPGTLGPIWCPELPEYLRQEVSEFDVIHLHGYRNFIHIPVIYYARCAGIPYVLQPHGSLPVVINSILFKRIYDRLVGRYELRNLKTLIALTDEEKQQALDQEVPEEKIVIIPNSYEFYYVEEDTTDNVSIREKYRIPSNTSIILYIGRINRKKGVDILIHAFAKIVDINAALVIVGPDDGLLKEVQSLVEMYGIQDRVIFTGLLTGQDIHSAYREANLFILPCRTDTFPNTILEACQACLPMVISETCEIADLIANKMGDVVACDPESFAHAMRDLLSDSEKYARYKANCPHVIQSLPSLNSVIDQLESLYDRVRTLE